jgi:hypothetical protein
VLDREAEEVGRAGAGEGVDRLVGVADDAEVLALAEPGVEQELLQGVDVLVFVDHEVAVLVAELVRDMLVLGEDRGGELEHALEVEEVAIAAEPFVGVVDPGHLDGLRRRGAPRLGGRRRVVGRAGLGDLRPLDLGGGVTQLRAAERQAAGASRLGHQAELGLHQPGRLSPDDLGPEVVQLFVGRGVERPGLYARGAELPEPAAQLAGGTRRERHGEHALRGDHAGEHGVRDPVGDRAGLARTRTGQHAHRAARGLGDLTLLRVEPGEHLIGLHRPSFHRALILSGPSDAHVPTFTDHVLGMRRHRRVLRVLFAIER